MLYYTDYLHLIKAGNEIFTSQLVSAILPIIEGATKVIKYRTKKCLPLVSLPDTCTYRYKTAPSYLPSPPPFCRPCQSPPSMQTSPSPPSPSSPTYLSAPKSPSIHPTHTHLPFARTLSGKIILNMYIYLFLIFLFLMQGVEAGGGEVSIFFACFISKLCF